MFYNESVDILLYYIIESDNIIRIDDKEKGWLRMKALEQEVIVQGEYRLAGTLALPQGEAGAKYPLIVLVHGSGNVDRDENAKGMRINAFKELSDMAVSLGFAVLRYDKRGVGQSEGNYLEAGFYDLVEDAAACVEYACQREEIDSSRVILIGHSEGCLVAPLVNKKIPVQGMVLISGSAEPLADTTEWQRKQMLEDMRRAAGFEGWLIRLLKVDQKLIKMNDQMIQAINSSDAPVIRYKGHKINAKWQREHAGYDVRTELPGIACPVLAVTGTKDIQVKPEQVEQICEQVSGPCEYRLIDNMTHLLRKTEAPHHFKAILKDYKQQVKRPVDDELKQVISDWLQRWLKGEWIREQ